MYVYLSLFVHTKVQYESRQETHRAMESSIANRANRPGERKKDGISYDMDGYIHKVKVGEEQSEQSCLCLRGTLTPTQTGYITVKSLYEKDIHQNPPYNLVIHFIKEWNPRMVKVETSIPWTSSSYLLFFLLKIL